MIRQSLVDDVKALRDAVRKLHQHYVPPFSVKTYEVNSDWIYQRLAKLPNWTGKSFWEVCRTKGLIGLMTITSGGYLVPLDGTFYTCTLEDFRKIIEWDWTNTRSYVADRFDCLAPDTPIIIRRAGEMPDIVTVEDLMPTSSPELGRPYYLNDIAVLSHYDRRSGLIWTKLNWIIAKRTEKRQYNVCGIVPIKVTEDHRVLGRWGKVVEYTVNDEVRREVKIDHPDSKSEFVYVSDIVRRGNVGERHIYPFWFKVVPIENAFYSTIHLDPDLAWVWGYFVADGAVLHRHGTPYNVCFYTTEQKIADRLISVLSDVYKDFEWVIYEARRAGVRTNLGVAKRPLLRIEPKVKIDSPRTLKGLAREFESKFYTRGGLKRVPKEVLNADAETAKAFLDGYICGDGTFYEGKYWYQIDTNSRPLALGIYVLARKLGSYPRVCYFTRNGREYVKILIPIEGRKPSQFDELHMFRRAVIHESVSHEPIVYDINTDTHMFVAGGQVIHNCEDFSFFFESHCAMRFGVNAVAVVLDYSSAHAYNLIFPYDLDRPLIYEPQTDRLYEVAQRDRTFYRLELYLVLI